jgi:hypothetical protein
VSFASYESSTLEIESHRNHPNRQAALTALVGANLPETENVSVAQLGSRQAGCEPELGELPGLEVDLRILASPSPCLQAIAPNIARSAPKLDLV